MSGLPCVASDVGDVRVALDGAGARRSARGLGGARRRARELADRPRSGANWARPPRRRALERYDVETMVAETVEVYDAALSG